MLQINVRFGSSSVCVARIVDRSWNLRLARSGSFTLDQLVLHGRDTLNSIRDIRSFAETVEKETLLARGDSNLLNGLQGKDVLIVFAESYGRVLLERSHSRGLFLPRSPAQKKPWLLACRLVVLFLLLR